MKSSIKSHIFIHQDQEKKRTYESNILYMKVYYKEQYHHTKIVEPGFVRLILLE
jgi:hypothetical protein